MGLNAQAEKKHSATFTNVVASLNFSR